MEFLAKRVHPRLTKNGLGGLIEYFDSEDHNLLFRFLLAIDKRFLGYSQFMRDWVAFEKRLANESVADVCRDFFDYLGLDLKGSWLPAEFGSPSSPAVLLGMNHEAIIEPLILAALLDRDDIKFVGMKVFQYLGTNVADLVLPVLPKKVAYDYQGRKIATFKTRFDIILDLYRQESMSLAEIEELNRLTLKKAAEHVSNGGLLIIFPNGGRDIKKSWYRGVGQLMRLLSPGVAASTPLYPIRTRGLNRKLLFHMAREAAFSHPSTTHVSADVYPPIFVPRHLARSVPMEILDYLKNQTTDRLKEKIEREEIPFSAEPLTAS